MGVAPRGGGVGGAQADVPLGSRGAGVLDGVPRQQREIDRSAPQLRCFVEAGEREQVLDEDAHPL